MKQILARPPLSPREPWSAWLMGEGPSARSAPGGDPTQPLNSAPDQWPAAQELVLLVPAGMLSWHRATLPRLPAHRWRQALSGLLEDELLADPASLHLALAPGAQAGAATWVAACDRAWLTQALETLEAAGRPAQRIVPEFEPGQDAWVVLGPPEAAQLVQTGAQGVQVLPLPEPAGESLIAWAQLSGGQPPAIWADPAMAEQVQQALQRPAGLLPTAQRLRQALESDWNLAQFELARSGSRRWQQRAVRNWQMLRQSPAWRPVRWGLLALLLVQVLGLQAWIWRQSAQAQHEEMKAILRSTFPQVGLIIDPLAQMQREVQSLSRASGTPQAGDLAVMLSQLAELGTAAPKRLDYSAGQLQLSDWPLQPAQVGELQSALTLRGYLLQASGANWQIKVKSP